MIRILLGDISTGRLQRLQYLGYYMLLTFLMILLGLGIAVMIGVSEQLIGGDLQEAQDKLRAFFGVPTMLVLIPVFFLFVFSHLNIMAKRIRDMGLLGWWGVLGIIIIEGLVSGLISQQGGALLNFFIGLLLLLIPSDTFAGND